MRWERRARFGWAPTAWAMLTIGVVGCGTAEYEERLNEQIKHLQLENKFVGLDPAGKETLLAALKNDQGVGAKVSFRKPTYFAGPALTLDSANPRNPAEKMLPGRVVPQELPDFPGFQFSYEQKNIGSLGLAYAYYGAQPTDAGTAEKIEAAFLQADKEILPPPEPAKWTTTTVETIDGGTVQWKKIAHSGVYQWWFDGNPDVNRLPGHFVIWMREEKGVQTLIGLRCTKMFVDFDYLIRMMTASAGTVRVASPAKID